MSGRSIARLGCQAALAVGLMTASVGIESKVRSVLLDHGRTEAPQVPEFTSEGQPYRNFQILRSFTDSLAGHRVYFRLNVQSATLDHYSFIPTDSIVFEESVSIANFLYQERQRQDSLEHLFFPKEDSILADYNSRATRWNEMKASRAKIDLKLASFTLGGFLLAGLAGYAARKLREDEA